MRALIVCPGRGSYGRNQLGTLPTQDPSIQWLDTFRRNLGRPTLTELDQAERFSAARHLAGEHASILTFGGTTADWNAVDRAKVEVVAITGNSMGWYTALHLAGALDLPNAARLVETMAQYQAAGVIGGQVLYPCTDESWRFDPELQDEIDSALEQPGVHLSIRLGGTTVLGGTNDALKALQESMNPLERGPRRFPLQLPKHSAFHTPLMNATSDRALNELADLQIQSPAIPLVAGNGRVYRPWASPDELLRYTLSTQVTDPYDFTAAMRTALGDYGPDAVICLGPGDTMGSAVAQVMISLGWRGLRDRRDFMDAQASDTPLVISMAREAQRACVSA